MKKCATWRLLKSLWRIANRVLVYEYRKPTVKHIGLRPRSKSQKRGAAPSRASSGLIVVCMPAIRSVGVCCFSSEAHRCQRLRQDWRHSRVAQSSMEPASPGCTILIWNSCRLAACCNPLVRVLPATFQDFLQRRYGNSSGSDFSRAADQSRCSSSTILNSRPQIEVPGLMTCRVADACDHAEHTAQREIGRSASSAHLPSSRSSCSESARTIGAAERMSPQVSA